MRLLLTNDDGIFAPGIAVLADALKGLGSLTVVAPDTERSAVGHAITISDPIHNIAMPSMNIVTVYTVI